MFATVSQAARFRQAQTLAALNHPTSLASTVRGLHGIHALVMEPSRADARRRIEQGPIR